MSRPNILLILNDDMGYSDIGCYGGEVQTPNLDRLAANGLRFTQFYNTARCCPTRASLLTGLHPHQAGVGHMISDLDLDGYRGDLNQRSVTIAQVLGSAGYTTYMSGKWHVSRHTGRDGPKHSWPRQRGFDRYFGIITGAAHYWNPETLTRENTQISVDEFPEDFFLTDAISDQAVEYIVAHASGETDQPFFLYTAYTAPHWPLHAHEEDIAKYRGRFASGWDRLREERIERMQDMGLIKNSWDLSPRDASQVPWEVAENKDWQQRRMEVYASQIDRMDQGIGRIIRSFFWLIMAGVRKNWGAVRRTPRVAASLPEMVVRLRGKTIPQSCPGRKTPIRVMVSPGLMCRILLFGVISIGCMREASPRR
jgi:arylsulfatase A-like enzyme